MPDLDNPFEAALSGRLRPLTFAEFAELLGVSRSTIWKEYRDKQFRPEEVRNTVDGHIITVAGAKRYIREHRHDATKDPPSRKK